MALTWIYYFIAKEANAESYGDFHELKEARLTYEEEVKKCALEGHKKLYQDGEGALVCFCDVENK